MDIIERKCYCTLSGEVDTITSKTCCEFCDEFYPLQLIDKSDLILTTKTPIFDFSNPPTDPIQLAYDLTEALFRLDGLGLAAPQVGLPYRAFAMRSVPTLVCFNPIIIDQGEDKITLEESCLTFPGYYVKISRPRTIKVRYTEPNGNVVKHIFDGMTARIFAHETNHCDGILCKQHATLYHREQAERNMKRNVK